MEKEKELAELCPICMDNPSNCYTDCGHSYCKECLSKINKCAMCRKKIYPKNYIYYTFDLYPEDRFPSGTHTASRIIINNTNVTNTDSIINILIPLFALWGFILLFV